MGEHHSGEDMEEGERRQAEEEESEKQETVQAPESERKRSEPGPSATISSQGSHDKDTVAAYTKNN